MAVTIPPPIAQIIAIPGDAITVQMRPVPGVPTEIIVHITRNGNREERFSLDEFTRVMTTLTAELAKARTRSLNTPQEKS